MPYYETYESTGGAWDLSQSRRRSVVLKTKKAQPKQIFNKILNSYQHESSNWNKQFNDSASTCSSSSCNSLSSIGWSFEHEKRHRFGPTISLESGYNSDRWGRRDVTTCGSSEEDLSPWFSGILL